MAIDNTMKHHCERYYGIVTGYEKTFKFMEEDNSLSSMNSFSEYMCVTSFKSGKENNP
jgi:hypothetical protein